MVAVGHAWPDSSGGEGCPLTRRVTRRNTTGRIFWGGAGKTEIVSQTVPVLRSRGRNLTVTRSSEMEHCQSDHHEAQRDQVGVTKALDSLCYRGKNTSQATEIDHPKQENREVVSLYP